MQLASTSAPRSATSSATCSYDRGYRRYKRTHKMMSSPGCCRPLNGLSGPIGIDFYPTSSPGAKFATEPNGVARTAFPPKPVGNMVFLFLVRKRIDRDL